MGNKNHRESSQGRGERAPVVYWMSRDQRVSDNRSLVFAQEQALEQNRPLVVTFCLAPGFLGATIRQYGFMLAGLAEVEKTLSQKNIHLKLLRGEPTIEIPKFVQHCKASVLVSDFDPLRIKRQWKGRVMEQITVPFHEIDAHNIIPHWVASEKQEYGAYTLRPKIERLLPEFLIEPPKIRKHPWSWKQGETGTSWDRILKSLEIDRSVSEVKWIRPGEKAAKKALKSFVKGKLDSYEARRNDPTCDGQSNLSPYLHFGQLSALRVALMDVIPTATQGLPGVLGASMTGHGSNGLSLERSAT